MYIRVYNMAMAFRQIIPIVVFALCGAAVMVGGVMADTVKLQPIEEVQVVPPWVPKWCADKGAKHPLHCAAGQGDVAEMERLIGSGAEIDSVTESGASPLYIAALAGQVAAINVLAKAGANVGLRHKKRNFTPLHAATGEGYIGAIEALIDAGANVNKATDWYKTTPLHLAAKQGYVGVTEVLIRAGASPDPKSAVGLTPMHEAAYSGHVAVIETLIKAGANPNITEREEYTSLHIVALMGHTAAMGPLIKAGVDVNAVDRVGLTPLHQATGKGYVEAVEILINAGAYPSPESPDGSTPMHKAARMGYVAVMELLIKAGANPNVMDGGGNTPLHIVAGKGHTAAIEMLVKKAADVYAVNKEGKTPLDIARDTKKWGVVSLLEKLAQGNSLPQDNSAPNVATAPAPEGGTVAEHVFENAWRSVVYIKTNKGQGSGVIIRPNIVATNCHVVESGGISVQKAENRRTTKTRYRAVIRRADDKNDFCLLDVKGLWGIPANVRRYDTLRVGESVYGLGAPQGLDLSMSTGIISQKRAAKGVRYIQTDVAISPGSSGGGLFDREGNLVGIMTAKIVGEEVEGIGFAIPADLALE